MRDMEVLLESSMGLRFIFEFAYADIEEYREAHWCLEIASN